MKFFIFILCLVCIISVAYSHISVEELFDVPVLSVSLTAKELTDQQLAQLTSANEHPAYTNSSEEAKNSTIRGQQKGTEQPTKDNKKFPRSCGKVHVVYQLSQCGPLPCIRRVSVPQCSSEGKATVVKKEVSKKQYERILARLKAERKKHHSEYKSLVRAYQKQQQKKEREAHRATQMKQKHVQLEKEKKKREEQLTASEKKLRQQPKKQKNLKNSAPKMDLRNRNWGKKQKPKSPAVMKKRFYHRYKCCTKHCVEGGPHHLERCEKIEKSCYWSRLQDGRMDLHGKRHHHRHHLRRVDENGLHHHFSRCCSSFKCDSITHKCVQMSQKCRSLR